MKKQKSSQIDFSQQLKSVKSMLITAVTLTILATWLMFDALGKNEKIYRCWDERAEVQQAIQSDKEG